MMLNLHLVIKSETKGIQSDIIFYEYTAAKHKVTEKMLTIRRFFISRI